MAIVPPVTTNKNPVTIGKMEPVMVQRFSCIDREGEPRLYRCRVLYTADFGATDEDVEKIMQTVSGVHLKGVGYLIRVGTRRLLGERVRVGAGDWPEIVANYMTFEDIKRIGLDNLSIPPLGRMAYVKVEQKLQPTTRPQKMRRKWSK